MKKEEEERVGNTRDMGAFGSGDDAPEMAGVVARQDWEIASWRNFLATWAKPIVPPLLVRLE